MLLLRRPQRAVPRHEVRRRPRPILLGRRSRECLLPAALSACGRPVCARHRGDRRRGKPDEAGEGHLEDRLLCRLGAMLAGDRSPARSGRPWAVAVALGVLALSGCGLGAGPAPSAVHLTVTRDFGASIVRSYGTPRVRGQETVMSLLLRNATVS